MHMKNNLDRRQFLANGGRIAATAAGAGVLGLAKASHLEAVVSTPAPNKLIWANLIHLGYNMWSDRPVEERPNDPTYAEDVMEKSYLRCDEPLWNDIMKKMSHVGMNMVIIDIGEGLAYKSYPELGAEGAWTHEKMRTELAKIRDLGLEPIPKLNFSTTHDIWLKEYSRMVSTKKYYEVCSDLIEEVCELFDQPRFFHLGYDEETAIDQKRYNYAVARQHELWWHDFYFFVGQVEKNKVRPWIWSDYVWHNSGVFYEKMPKSVLQSNWYYGTFEKYPDKFDNSRSDKLSQKCIETYIELDEAGYDQMPTGSTWYVPENFGQMVDFCKKHINPQRLKGFVQTPWRPTLESSRKRHMDAIELVAKAIAKWE